MAGGRDCKAEGETVEREPDADGRHSEAGEGPAVRDYEAGGEHHRAEEVLGARVRGADDGRSGDENEDGSHSEERAEDPLAEGNRPSQQEARGSAEVEAGELLVHGGG